jgi:hypothetical protein
MSNKIKKGDQNVGHSQRERESGELTLAVVVAVEPPAAPQIFFSFFHLFSFVFLLLTLGPFRDADLCGRRRLNDLSQDLIWAATATSNKYSRGEMMMRVALIHVYSRRERERKRETE